MSMLSTVIQAGTVTIATLVDDDVCASSPFSWSRSIRTSFPFSWSTSIGSGFEVTSVALAEVDGMIFMPESFVRVDTGVVNSGAWWGSADIMVPLAEVLYWRVKIAVNEGEEIGLADIVVPLAEVLD